MLDDELLFVYGTLRRCSDRPESRRLAAGAEWLGEAYFNGLLFDCGDYPGAVASSDPAHRVYGELYRLADPVNLLPLIDRYEEFGPEFSEPNEFVRVVHPVYWQDNLINAWLYLYNRPTAQLKQIDDGCF